MKFELKDVVSNPFRLTAKYPINSEKVEELKESIRTTEFWDNIVARERKDGKAEIAYGHHRLEALKALFPGTHEVNLIVRPLSDAKMVQMMARENSETYKTNVIVLIESIRAAVQAYGDGKITDGEWPAPALDTNKSILRYAPFFIAGEPTRQGRERGYTAQTLGQFIGLLRPNGRVVDRLVVALDALELIEQKYLRESELKDMSVTQLEKVVRKHQWQRNRDLEEQRERDTKQKEREAHAEAEKARKEAEQKKREADKQAQEATEKAEREKQAAEKAKREAEAAKKKDDQVASKKADQEAARKKVDSDKAEQEKRAAEKARKKSEEESEKKRKEAEKKEQQAKKEAEEQQRKKQKREDDEKAERQEIARKSIVKQLAEDIIKEGFRVLAKKFHPDAGGTQDQMVNLSDARAGLNKAMERYFERRVS